MNISCTKDGAGAGVGVVPTEAGVGVLPAEAGVGVLPAEAGVGVLPAEAGVGVLTAGTGVGVETAGTGVGVPCSLAAPGKMARRHTEINMIRISIFLKIAPLSYGRFEKIIAHCYILLFRPLSLQFH